MIKKLLFMALLLPSLVGFSQEQLVDTLLVEKFIDTTVYKKDINYVSKKEFQENLKEKYSGRDFTYTEEKEAEKENDAPSPTTLAFFNGLGYFMKYIFPYLLGAIIIFIILKTFLGSEIGFWNFKSKGKKSNQKLFYEEEDIHEIDLDSLLKKAIQNNEYRLAVRYYYLLVLRQLSTNKFIDYHKEKTNTEYLLEIENLNIKKQFSYLSYAYSYVWYGQFSIDKNIFDNLEKEYKSFINSQF
ncbi:hypothetical protein [Polaribacter sp.]|uniref:hypothetical protein n=1 Tax=Polaribacter sp. TaxID=1920175 RepID=UPI003EF0AA67